MISHLKFATAVTAAALLAGSASARASDAYSFPSPNGVSITASTATFVQTPAGGSDLGALTPSLGGSMTVGVGKGSAHKFAPLGLPIGETVYTDRFARAHGADAYSYRFLTHALSSSSFANYAADYYRLFSPGIAVTTWTERMAGIVDVGYGGAVDSWTAGAYYLARMRGPRHRRETAPDLSVMPKFRPHPELEQDPTFIPPER